jgi:hypothetical protein
MSSWLSTFGKVANQYSRTWGRRVTKLLIYAPCLTVFEGSRDFVPNCRRERFDGPIRHHRDAFV